MVGKPARVLIVDDSEDATQLLEQLVVRRGHYVRVAHDVAEALRVAEEFRPDVALLDIMIRCESGYFLGRELLELPGLENCRLIAISGFELVRQRELAEAVGFHERLSKPIDPMTLFHAIEAPAP